MAELTADQIGALNGRRRPGLTATNLADLADTQIQAFVDHRRCARLSSTNFASLSETQISPR